MGEALLKKIFLIFRPLFKKYFNYIVNCFYKDWKVVYEKKYNYSYANT